MKLEYDEAAVRVLARHEKRSLLRAKIEQLADDPDNLGNNVKRLRGRSDFRLRVGDVRIFFEIEDDVLRVTAVAPRGAAYD